MSSDKRRGGASKVKPSLKQRTLLDSFVTRLSSKGVPLELESVEANVLPPATIDLQLDRSSSAIDIGVPLPEDKNALEVLVSPSDSRQSPSPEGNGRRRPSIVIIEDTPEPSSTGPQQIPHTPSRKHCEESGKVKELPIIVDSSPIKCRPSLERDIKPIHPFFLPKSARSSQTHSDPPRKKAVCTAMSLNESHLYPRGIPQHVRGLQTTFGYNRSPLPKRPDKTCEGAMVEVANYDILRSPAIAEQPPLHSHRVRLLPVGGKDPTSGIPEDIINSYPAVARLIDLKPADKPTSHRPWADRWRPSCAQEVLGNEQSAIYLRDWLRALELQLDENSTNSVPTNCLEDHKKAKVNGKAITRGIKRPRVIRAVDKTRRKRLRLGSDEDEDDWIVQSDEGEDVQADYDQFDEFGEIILNEPPASSPSSSVHESSQNVTEKPEQSSYLGQLHNTILLTGPPGCGKTASVYACAEELGWEIFEVYPGIGRRNAANIDNLIGEVGKNHLVLQRPTSSDSLKTFLQSKKKRKSVEDYEEYDALSQISPRKKSTFELNPPGPREAKGSNKSVRQSLILLEEVDILFKEDTNFWTTVTKIIQECKRPVICTCNDLSLVPMRDLPLQTTLFYAPCPEGPAACYLQALCAAEGYAVSWKDLVTLYTNPHQVVNHTPDLRATINALQVISIDTVEVQVEETSGPEGIPEPSLLSARKFVERSNFLSFLDSFLDRNIASTLAELGNHIASDDDETGHIILFDRHAEDGTSFEIYDRQNEIVSAAVLHGNKVFEMDVRGEEMRLANSEQHGQRIREMQRMAGREICRIGADATSISVEYLPYLRQIVGAEDRLEMEEEEKRPRVGRKTRNSTRNRYVRMVELTEHTRASVDSVRVTWK